MVSHGFDVIQHFCRSRIAVDFIALVDDLTQLFLVAQKIDLKAVRILGSVDKAEILRNILIEDESSHRGSHRNR